MRVPLLVHAFWVCWCQKRWPTLVFVGLRGCRGSGLAFVGCGWLWLACVVVLQLYYVCMYHVYYDIYCYHIHIMYRSPVHGTYNVYMVNIDFQTLIIIFTHIQIWKFRTSCDVRYF